LLGGRWKKRHPSDQWRTLALARTATKAVDPARQWRTLWVSAPKDASGPRKGSKTHLSLRSVDPIDPSFGPPADAGPWERRLAMSATIPITTDELAAFNRDGFLRVPAAFAAADAALIEAEWWAELADVYGARRDDPATWRAPKGDLKRPKLAESQHLVETRRAAGVLDGLLGAGEWRWPRDWGRSVVTMPSGAPPEAWDVPSHIWHWDGVIGWNLERLASLFVVAFVSEVRPRGGGTAVLAGSPRLLMQRLAEVGSGPHQLETFRRDRFSRCHPWLAALTGHATSPPDRVAAFMSEGVVIDGVSLRVEELSGAPGDMAFCHPLLLHCAAGNCRETPRFMRIKQQLLSREGVARAKLAAAARA
jgi:hypothetical protein